MSTRHRLAAVWFADIVDYSGLAASDQGGAMRLVRVFQRCTRECVQRYGGHVVKFLGDGALVEFRSLQGAIAAADALRGSFSECLEEAGMGEQAIRIGIHSGEMVEADGDVYGDGVNVAARILDEAEPGEILVSNDAWRQVRQQSELEFESLGGRELQGVGEVGLHRLVRVGEIEPEAASTRSGLRGLWDEIQRRHVFRIAAVYAVVAWLLIQVSVATFDPLNLPDWALSLVVVLTLVGFPIAVVLAWAFEVTPEGVRRTTAESQTGQLGRFAVAGAAIVAALVVGWYLLDHGLDGTVSSSVADTAGVVLDPSRLAVLYFEGRPDTPEVEALAAGFTESVIDKLSGIEALDVVSRHGVERVQGLPNDSAAGALGAGLLVDGTVDRSGERLRVRVRLVDAREGKEVDSWTVERPMGELFELQEEVAGDITRNLRNLLGERLRRERALEESTSVEAWELVQRAERLAKQAEFADSDGVEASLRADADSLLARAEELSPGWTEPTLMRAELDAWRGDRASYERGLEHVRRVFARKPGDPEALRTRGILYDSLASIAKDSTEAARFIGRATRDLRAAVAADPSSAPAWIALANLLYNDLWELAEARRAAAEAHEQDEFLLEEDHYVWLCEISLQLGDYEEAREWCSDGLRGHPDRVRLALVDLYVLASPGVEPDPAAAWDRVEQIARQEYPEANVPPAKILTAAVLVRADLPDSARAVILDARSQAPDYLAPFLDYLEGYVQLVLGNEDAAIRLIGQFLRAWPIYRSLLARDIWMQPLAGDPRFERLVDRARLPIYCRILCEPPAGP